MKGESNNYYLYLEASVFLFREKNEILLYDTSSFKHLLFEKCDRSLSNVIDLLVNPENMYSILLTHKQITHNFVADFISQIRRNFMGDLIPTNISTIKPIVMMPILNFQKDRNRDAGIFKEFLIGDEILELLSDVDIYIDDKSCLMKPMAESTLFSIIDRLNNIKARINIHAFQPYKNDIIATVQDYIMKHEISAGWVFDYMSFYEGINCKMFNNLNNIRLLVEGSINESALATIMQFCKANNILYSYEFHVKNKTEIKNIEEYLLNHGIEKYDIKPIFINNLQFFRKCVYLTKQDILKTKISKRQIFANQTINTYNFGKIQIKCNGDVYSNIYLPKIGNIKKQSLQKILFKEMKNGKSWFRTRSQKPCNKCVFQYLCPPPSEFEILIGKPNLCYVK